MIEPNEVCGNADGSMLERPKRGKKREVMQTNLGCAEEMNTSKYRFNTQHRRATPVQHPVQKSSECTRFDA